MPPSLDRPALHAAYREGLDPGRVAAECLAGAEAPGARGIFISLAPEAARAAVAGLGPFDPQAKPLWGLPFVVKDNIDLAGIPTTAACPAFAQTPGRSATAVARLLAAGAVPIGKTNLDQFATGLVGVRSPYPPPLNPFDPEVVPGGSSSGSAVAVARGLASFALGTDTAGSGRVPAGLNNVVGLKPTLGAVPVRGVVPACQTLDCVSVFGLTVEDAWAAASAMAGFDAEDPWSRRVAFRAPGPVPSRVRAGVPDARSRRFFGDAAAERAFDRALALYAGLGVELVEVDFAPLFAVAAMLYEGAWVAERYAAIRPFIAAHRGELHPTTARIILGAEALSAADAFEGVYRLAALRRAAEPLWDGLDLLAVPTVPRAYRLAEIEADPIGPNATLGTYTNFVNLLDLCALAVPGPFRADGFPSGTTLIAPAGRDGFLASVGAALHRAAGVPMGATGRPLPEPSPAAAVGDAPAGEVELAVIGAHLSGMPLNRDLVALGGTFRRAVDTRPEYRLHALPGGPPARPGLLRVAEGGGAVAAEVWSLPPDGFGRFVDTVPPPLCIGRVRLADGTAPAGFLCEPAGLDGARDITHLGGWRAYVDQAKP